MNFKSNTVIALIIAFGLILASQGGAYLLRQSAAKTEVSLTAPLDSISGSQLQVTSPALAGKGQEPDRLHRLNELLVKHKEHHKLTFIELYGYHFASISLLTVFSILTAAFGFLVGQNGWKQTDLKIQSAFVTCGALASFYGLSVSVFQQDVSIQENLKSFIVYDNCQKEIFNYCSTDPASTISGDTLTFSEFHSYILKKMVITNGIHLEFDDDAVNVDDFLKLTK